MKVKLFIVILIFISSSITGQKKMTPETWDTWNSIENVKISPNGKWVSYNIKPGKGDMTLNLYNSKTGDTKKFDRASKAEFDFNNSFIVFKISPHKDTIDELKRQKIKKKKWPKDTLAIYSLNDAQFDKVANIESFKIPEKAGGVIAFKAFPRDAKKDSTLVKKEDSKNGSQLFIFDYDSDDIKTYDYVLKYGWSKFNKQLYIHTVGRDSTNLDSVLILKNLTDSPTIIHSEEGKYYKFTWSDNGNNLAFIKDTDTTKIKARPYELCLWRDGKTQVIGDQNASFLNEGWQISQTRNLMFSEDGNKLYFGTRPLPVEQDSTLLDSEKVDLEIWNYKDGLMYTQQNVNLKKEKDRTFLAQYDLRYNSFKQISTPENQDAYVNKEHKGDVVLTLDPLPYQKYISWLGHDYKDVYLTETKSKRTRKVLSKVKGNPRMSPSEKYISWYNSQDTAYMTYDLERNRLRKVTESRFYNEVHDVPTDPWNSGFMAWEENDKYMYIYDHYDIWKINPNGESLPERITYGREKNTRYRYIKIDRELKSISGDTTILVKYFNDEDMTSGYAFLNLKTKDIREIEGGKFDYTTRVIQSKNKEKLIFTKASFDHFPDLIYSNSDFTNQVVISNANPQQKDYDWGSIELFTWKDSLGHDVKGLIAKPSDFNPNKKYPLIVNFYEKSSNRLYRHRAPFPHRSTINYTYWTNKGYVIFNPDVRYETGYPGKSCYDAVMSGVDAVLKLGFIDEKRMGLQGHSWGGYQIAHLLTKTNRFKCAEAGAPVVNMISAYGGIRWGTGMSRQFQYERTQSRLGATLWEKPELYLENSPVFNLDKVNTPVLILHNDNDGAVPWYQGIEYFVGLRRLGKPAWMLNYKDEPHWPLKRQNRIDFNKRMEQFFDHYLMDAPMPVWMEKGVPAVEQEYNDGFQIER